VFVFGTFLRDWKLTIHPNVNGHRFPPASKISLGAAPEPKKK
jgi:hypothetical protein